MKFLRRLFRIREPEGVEERFGVFYNGHQWTVRDYDGLIEYPFSAGVAGLEAAFDRCEEWNEKPLRAERYSGYRFTE